MALPPRPNRSAPRVPPRRPVTALNRSLPQRRAFASSFSLWLLVFLVVIGGVGYYVYDRTFGAINAAKIPQVVPTKVGAAPPPPLLSAPFNVLLIGVDLRQAQIEDGARSDTLIVVRVDPVGKTASMLSIPRDTYIDAAIHERLALPDGMMPPSRKINAAYSFGYNNPEIYAGNTDPQIAGANLARQTVEQFLGIDINYSAQIDFQGFETLINELGGVTVDVPNAILDAEYPTDDYGYMRLYIPPGLQRMDGTTALRYARTRHADNDFGRAKRQQQVLQAMLDELKQRGILGKVEAVPALMQTLRDSLRTDLPINDLSVLKGLASLAQDLNAERIMRYTLEPGKGGDQRILPSNGFDIHWSPQYVAQVVAQFQGGPNALPAEPEKAVIQVQNGRGIKGLAGQVTLELKLAKFTTSEPTDAPSADNPNTLILDYTGKPATVQRLAALFKIKPANIRDMSAQQAAAPFGVDIVLLVGDDYQAPNTAQGARRP